MLMLYCDYTNQVQEGLQRKWWVKSWASEERRQTQGLGTNLIPELRETFFYNEDLFRMEEQLIF